MRWSWWGSGEVHHCAGVELEVRGQGTQVLWSPRGSEFRSPSVSERSESGSGGASEEPRQKKKKTKTSALLRLCALLLLTLGKNKQPLLEFVHRSAFDCNDRKAHPPFQFVPCFAHTVSSHLIPPNARLPSPEPSSLQLSSSQLSAKSLSSAFSTL